MRHYAQTGNELDKCITAFSSISGKPKQNIVDEIVNSTEDFDTIMFKQGSIEMFFTVSNQNKGTLIIN